jgi:hypothetical protein
VCEFPSTLNVAITNDPDADDPDADEPEMTDGPAIEDPAMDDAEETVCTCRPEPTWVCSHSLGSTPSS